MHDHLPAEKKTKKAGKAKVNQYFTDIINSARSNCSSE